MKGSMTMLGMVVGSTLGGVAPTLIGGGLISSLIGGVIGGVLGIWAGLRFNEWMS
jgi:outer membrane lipoprotein SlyB